MEAESSVLTLWSGEAVVESVFSMSKMMIVAEEQSPRLRFGFSCGDSRRYGMELCLVSSVYCRPDRVPGRHLAKLNIY